ncbi:penicillin acylase family protein [Microbacterium stercoris]|uniref:Penicillin acylase family protein n=1 Tax=Microbacterium stercoris TaxID=2820289 RepID=A0A939QRC6_9MICO|nr:penicillin acylase family protein [Microbacterium stercoris]MBO3664116.1 penicillin acylase family protein [Microbacterium stercoris]
MSAESRPSGAPPFEVWRDELGVPHVRAADELSLAYGQGWVTARDRAWQIEVDRWRAEGRLAERIGAAGLAWDRFAVRVRLADTARRVHEALPATERTWLAAYTAGVDAGLADMRTAEERALDAHFGAGPQRTPWPAWGPVGVFLVAHVLFSGFPSVLWRDHVARRVAPEAAAWFGEPAPSSGSNAWAIARSASGAPLLAGDPHRLLELPGVYQQVRLACPEYDVVGLAFPGVPGVQHFGHAGEAAWGITNAMAHHVEVFAERLRAGEAAGPDGWAPTASGVETLAVRGGQPERAMWVETERGPVVAGDLAGDAWSVRWPVRVTADVGVPSWRALLRARSARDVARAFEGWVDPVNRVLAADREEALSLTAGRLVQRDRAERVLPVPAWSDAARERPWALLPATAPVRDVHADANERPSDPDHDLGWRYAHHRADRLRTLLAEPPAGGETPAAQHRLHADTVHLGAAPLVLLLPAGEPRADRLRAWAAEGARMDAASGGAALFAAFRHALVARVATHPTLAPLADPHPYGEIFDPWFSLRARVAEALPRLLDVLYDEAGRRQAAAAALADAVAEPTWGATHRVHPLAVLADVPGLDPAALPSVPAVALSGDADTPWCTASVPGVSDLSWRGSVARWVWDLADRDASRWGVPFGASGDPASPHFDDQLTTWARAGTSPVVTDWTRLHRETPDTPATPEERTA